MRNYVLIFVCYSHFTQSDTNIVLAKPSEKITIYQPQPPKKPSFFESIFGKIIKPKPPKTTAVNPRQVKKKPVKIKYKKYVMLEGEGLWQVADKKKIAIKEVPQWIDLIAKKNKLTIKDNHDDYVLNAGTIIWIPM
ncbi:hypothetical protein ACFOW1_05770 [Parasediminibacterium paludis]|uniref:LysM domain-containing protein n=1 Tax=Parasediminibacterium paludis TaxID=908966 RepID=A0ABV8PTF4_9BACT